MKRLLTILDQFFFERVSASGFGLMRILWAGTALAFLLGSAPDIIRYWSDAGILPRNLGYLVFRNEYRFTLLDTFTEPLPVLLLWCTYVTTLFCTLFGIWTRTMTVSAVLLMFSFHERNLQPLGGGDTLLRNIGFILMIAPEIDAFSMDRLERQWKYWWDTGKLLPALKTHIWPYRLLLWQFLIIYSTSLWDKLQGTMWLDGTTVAAIFHHTHFFRWPKLLSDLLSFFSPYVCFTFLVYEATWLLLLVPRNIWWVLPERVRKHSLKRWILCGGIFFHGTIALLMDVGTFSFAMFTGYTGLLLERDFAVLKNIANGWWLRKTRNYTRETNGKISVLYDGDCRLCTRSIFTLILLNHLGRLSPVDFRNAASRKRFAPDIALGDLDRAMHIRMPDGTTLSGFDAFRRMTWHLPALWPLAPVLSLPGVPTIGRKVYAVITANRKRCVEGTCAKDENARRTP